MHDVHLAGNYSFEIGVKGDDGKKIDGFKFAIPVTISLAYDPATLTAGTLFDACLPPSLCIGNVLNNAPAECCCRNKPTTRREMLSRASAL